MRAQWHKMKRQEERSERIGISTWQIILIAKTIIFSTSANREKVYKSMITCTSTVVVYLIYIVLSEMIGIIPLRSIVMVPI